MLTFEDFNSFCVKSTNFLVDEVCYSQRDGLKSHYKGDGTIVTDADFLIEDKLRESISSSFPDHAIYGEERESINESSPYRWLIDPVDGTFGFSRGVPLFGTLIGFLENNVPRYGFLRLPMVHDNYLSGDNKTALLNGAPLENANFSGWDNSLILTTDTITIESSPIKEVWHKALNFGSTARTWGDCFGYYLVCTGQADLMADTNLKPHDILPLLPILKGAGLIIQQFECDDYSNIVACKREIARYLY